jgi:hypothetical protein
MAPMMISRGDLLNIGYLSLFLIITTIIGIYKAVNTHMRMTKKLESLQILQFYLLVEQNQIEKLFILDRTSPVINRNFLN